MAETKKTTNSTKKGTTTKKTASKKETVKEEKITIEEEQENKETKNEKSNEEKETMMGTNKNTELVLVYIFTLLGFVFSIMNDKNVSKNMKFHYNQAATIWIISIIIYISSKVCSYALPIMNIIFKPINAILLVFTIIALVKACNDEKYEIPVINDLSKTIWK